MIPDAPHAAIMDASNAPVARWTVYRAASGRAHRLTVESTEARRLRGMLLGPHKRIALLNDFACHHLGMAVDAARPNLETLIKIGEDGSWEPGVAPSWTYARSYGPVRWSLSLAWEGQGAPWFVFQHKRAAPIAFTLEDIAFLYIALPIALEGCAREADIDALHSDDVCPPEPASAAEKAGKPWSDEDEATVWALWDAGRSIEEIAQAVQRAPSAIASRFGKLTTSDR